MSKVIITTDSTADLSIELIEKNEIVVSPLYINLGETSYADNGTDIVPDDIYKYVKESGKTPTTSANPIGNYTEFFKKFVDEGYDVVHFNLSANFSCTHQNALLAAEDFDNVYVVDTRNLSTGSGLLVLKAAELAKEGKSASEIAEEIKGLTSKVDASFVLDDLTYLHKGGRCSSVAKLGANLLKLKPCIQVKDGAMGVAKKYRGDYKICVKQYIQDKLAEIDNIDTKRIFITHTACSDEIVNLAVEIVKASGSFDEILETTAGCTITTHCGPNTLGILFFRKTDLA